MAPDDNYREMAYCAVKSMYNKSDDMRDRLREFIHYLHELGADMSKMLEYEHITVYLAG